MIYRVHKYNENIRYGTGHLLGYVSLCSGYINSSSVYQSLVQSELISASYLSEREVSLSGNGYTELNTDIYIFCKRTPRKYLYIIYPVEFKPKEKSNFGNDIAKSFVWSGQTVSAGSIFNFTPAGNIVWNTPPAMIPQQEYFIQNTAPQIQQIIIDDPLGQPEIDDDD